jgi:hypothetical protein
LYLCKLAGYFREGVKSMPDQTVASEPKPVSSPGPVISELELTMEAAVYEEAQNQISEEAFNTGTITLVLQLMPLDDHPQGRMGLLSIRNDSDPLVFSPPLRGDVLTELLEVPQLARLVAELRALLPHRLKERQAKEKEQASSPKPQSASAHLTGPVSASSKGAKPGKKPEQAHFIPSGEKVSSNPEITNPPATGPDLAIPQAAFSSEPPAKTPAEVVTGPVPEATRQLTLF